MLDLRIEKIPGDEFRLRFVAETSKGREWQVKCSSDEFLAYDRLQSLLYALCGGED